MKWLRKLN